MKRIVTVCTLLFMALGVMSFRHSAALTEIMQKMMSDMKSMTMTGDPDNDFAMMTKRHHEGAIAMSNVEIKEGKDAQLKAMAQKMIAEQQKDNKDFSAFLAKHKPHSNSDYGTKSMAMMNQSGAMNMQMTNNLDMDFAMMMVQHHQDGIKTSQEYLKSGKEAQIIKIANKDIAAQQQDIKKLNDWMSKKGGMDHSAHSGQ